MSVKRCIIEIHHILQKDMMVWKGKDYKNTFVMDRDLTAKDYQEPMEGAYVSIYIMYYTFLHIILFVFQIS